MNKREFKPKRAEGAGGAGARPFRKTSVGGARKSDGPRGGSGRGEGGDKPAFGRSEGGPKKAYGRRSEGGDKPAFERSEGGPRKPYGRRTEGGDKPAFGRSEGGPRKPYGRRTEGGDKPAFGRSEGGPRKPYARRTEGGDKPAFERREGGYKKPAYAKSEEGGEKRAYRRRDEAEGKPAYGRRTDRDAKPGFTKREDRAKPAYGRKDEAPGKTYGKGPARKGAPAFEKRTLRDKPAKEAYVSKKPVTDAEDEEEDDLVEERTDRIEGRNPVFEALKSERPLNKIFIEKGNTDSALARIAALAREREIPIQFVERRKLDMLSTTRIHQGVILEAAAHEYVEVDEILEKAAMKGEEPFIVILDGITDTNNMGSIIRSAECAGVHGVIIPKRRSATLNATVAKVAAGAQEFVPVARVSNLAQTIRDLKTHGIWVTGADMAGEKLYTESDLKGPIALVIGSEGEGISRIVKEECDYLVKIPLKGKISSLNAGVAAALIMYEISRKRG